MWSCQKGWLSVTDDRKALSEWLDAIGERPTALNDLQAIASEVASWRGLKTVDPAVLTALAHAALTDAFRAERQGDKDAVVDALARGLRHVLVLSERQGAWLGERLVAQLRGEVDQEGGGGR